MEMPEHTTKARSWRSIEGGAEELLFTARDAKRGAREQKKTRPLMRSTRKNSSKKKKAFNSKEENQQAAKTGGVVRAVLRPKWGTKQ